MGYSAVCTKTLKGLGQLKISKKFKYFWFPHILWVYLTRKTCGQHWFTSLNIYYNDLGHPIVFIIKYLMIEIAVIDAWVPCDDARIDAIFKKHINLFLNPFPYKIKEHKKVAYPMACCIVAKSKSFLMMWLIFNFTNMNPKHDKAVMIPNIPVAITKQ